MEHLRYRTRRVTLALAVMLLLTGLLALLLREDFVKAFNIPPRTYLLFVLSTFGYGAAILSMLYLRGGLPFQWRTIDPELLHPSIYGGTDLMELEGSVRSLRERLEALSAAAAGLSTEDKEKLAESVRHDLSGRVAAEVIATVDKKYADMAAERAQLASFRNILGGTSLRLRSEIQALGRRGNLNLVIGTLTTLLAAGLLAYMVLSIQSPMLGVPEIVSYYIPRITTVIFIEIFSFFFLRLYKASLADIKYYQNELTTVEMRGAALEVAVNRGDTPAITVAIEQLARLDRNAMDMYRLTEKKRWFGSRPSRGADVANILERVVKLLIDEKKTG